MPELPDVIVYIEALKRHIVGRPLEKVHLHSPFVLRSVDPPIETISGLTVRDVRRVGKRIVLVFDGNVFLVLHLMIAGRLRWRVPGQKPGMGPKLILASLVFPNGTLFFTEASSTKRASMQLVGGEAALHALDPGGVEPLDATIEAFHDTLTRENHTLKRALTDPHLFSGIGNAYSDEILHAAKLSPLKLTRSLTDAELRRLHGATRSTLTLWIDRLRAETGGGFPEKVTAFRDAMAVHGRFRRPCPACGSPIQRIRRGRIPASRFKGSDPGECNYCATCQTGGRLLADRSLSRLLKAGRPKSIDDINQ